MPARFDVVLVADCRTGSGGVASVVEEARAQEQAGLTTGVVHVPARPAGHPAGASQAFDRRLIRLFDAGVATLAVEPAEVRAGLAILRLPDLISGSGEVTASQLRLPHLRVDRALVVVGHVADGQFGTATAAEVADRLRTLAENLGVEISYAPTGPAVRHQLHAMALDGPVLETDWVDIVDANRWAADPERCFGRARPALGMHTPPAAPGDEHWPVSREDLLAAYPDDPAVAVRILGAADPALRLLRRLPPTWTVLPDGAQAPEHFLADLDAWVGFPDPARTDIRPVLEALASGTPTILPVGLEPLLGPGPAYGAPADVLPRITSWRDAPERAHKSGVAGQQLVRDRFGWQAHARRVAELLRGTAVSVPSVESPRNSSGPAEFPDARRRSVLFVSSNGAGVGHLMRLMSMARRASGSTNPVFLTLSQAVPAVRRNGFCVEYLMSRGYCDLDYQAWHALLRARLGEMVRAHDVRALVFDGTWLYRGLLQALDDHPQVKAVWSRRGMWRAETDNPTLQNSARFDLILEPGEFAAANDVGPTARRRHEVTRVAPITYLDTHELLDCGAAREHLGLDPDRRAALVQLGAGSLNDISTLTAEISDRLARERDLQICVTQSIIAERANATGGHAVSIAGIYPVARYLRAFDFAVAAPGYNSFHELVASGVPTLFVPNPNTASDDQAARSRHAQAMHVGLHADPSSPEEVMARLEELLDPVRREALACSAKDLSPDNGAADAMAAIERLIRDDPGTAFSVQPEVAAEASAPPGDRARDRAAPVPAGPQWRRARSVLVRATSLPGARACARRALDVLPEGLQTGVRRQLGRLMRGAAGSHTAAAVRVPVPPGSLLPAAERSDLPGVAVILGPDLTRDHCRAALERIAALQVAHRNFAPLIVTFDDTLLAPVRALGLPVELMLPPRDRELLGDGSSWPDYVRDRLGHLRSVYRLDRMVVHGPIAGLEDLETLSLALAGQP